MKLLGELEKLATHLEAQVGKVVGSFVKDASLLRGMGAITLGEAESVAASLRHPAADVEHLVYVVLGLSDVARALAKHGAYPDDARAAVVQLLEDREPVGGADATSPARSPRLNAVRELAARDRHAGSAVVRATATALPPELAFLRKPLEAAARDVASLYDGALSAKNGAMTFEAWAPSLHPSLGRMQRLADRPGMRVWSMAPVLLLSSVLVTPELTGVLERRGLDTKELLAGIFRASVEGGLDVKQLAPPPPGHVASVGPDLFATLLRAESYAADDATNVQLRHLLAALHDEPPLAPFVARLVA